MWIKCPIHIIKNRIRIDKEVNLREKKDLIFLNKK